MPVHRTVSMASAPMRMYKITVSFDFDCHRSRKFSHRFQTFCVFSLDNLTAAPSVALRQGQLMHLQANNSVQPSSGMADLNVQNGEHHSRMQSAVSLNNDDDVIANPNGECDFINLGTANAVEVCVKPEVKVENEIATDLPMIRFDPIEYNASRAWTGSHQSNPSEISSLAQKERNGNVVNPKKCGRGAPCKPYDRQGRQSRARPKPTASCGDKNTLFQCDRCMRLFSIEKEKDEHEGRCRKKRYECRRCDKFVTVNRLARLEHAEFCRA